MSSIITITSDLGNKDPNLGLLKGRILSLAPNAQVVDISNEIQPFNIAEAAYIVKNAFTSFPENSVHIISVGTYDRSHQKFLAIYYQKQYFLVHDNGLFSLVMTEAPDQIVEITISDTASPTFPTIDVLIPAACSLAKGESLSAIGGTVNSVLQGAVLQPAIQQDNIRGSIIYIDNYGNAVSNITKKLFDEVKNDRGFVVYFKRNESLSEISQNYNDVAEGEKLCFFNHNGNLEIAINFGSAGDLFGLNVGDTIQIDFV